MNISLAFCDDLEGWSEGEGREARHGGDLYIITPDLCGCMAETNTML